jgi:hypothetical protein
MQAVLEVAKQFTFDKATERTPINLVRLPEVLHPNLLVKNIEPVDEPADETVESVCGIDEPTCETENLPVEETDEDREAKWLAKVSERILFAQAAWNGVYSGLYGMKSKKTGVPKPTDECFGEWIIDDAKGIRNFFRSMKKDLWATTIKDYEFAWYSTGDLMFKNEDVCHFRMVAQDLLAYCNAGTVPKESKTNKLYTDADFIGENGDIEAPVVVGNCNSTKILTNVQTNAFNLIT